MSGEFRHRFAKRAVPVRVMCEPSYGGRYLASEPVGYIKGDWVTEMKTVYSGWIAFERYNPVYHANDEANQ